MVVPKRMTEANEQDVQDQEQKRPLTLRSGGTLGLRRPVETGQVRQSFSHGRSKAVTVEVRKKRAVAPGAAVAEPSRPEAAPTVARAQPARVFATVGEHDDRTPFPFALDDPLGRQRDGVVKRRRPEGND